MQYFDLHAHMVSRTTDDYMRMAMSGCVGLSEPAFWAGWDRSSASGFADYFRQLTTFEPARAKQFGIQHFCWLCLNPKEGENRELARDVLNLLPDYLSHPSVLGIGEIGLNRNTVNEVSTFRDHVALAAEHSQSILIHTPHLEDKLKGTRLTLRVLNERQLDRGRVLVDHTEEHTLDMVLAEGYWAGLTLYPTTKCSSARAVDLIERHGSERICVSSACDWGDSNPLAIPRLVLEMRRRGHPEESIRRLVLDNPRQFLSQSAHFAAAPYSLTCA